jgi:uncharacterized protein (DUF1778 family)
MAKVEISGGRLVIRLDRSDRLWAFRLADEHYARLVVEVDDPAATAAAIRQAIDGGATTRGRPGRPR